MLPLSWSLDHVGPMTRTVADAAAVLQAIAGYDLHEPTSANQPVPDFTAALASPVKTLRLGVPRDYVANLDPEIQAAFAAALATCRSSAPAAARSTSRPTPTTGR